MRLGHRRSANRPDIALVLSVSPSSRLSAFIDHEVTS